MTQDELLQVSRLAADALVKKYGALHIEHEDAAQDAAEWLLTHDERVERARLDNQALFLPQVLAEVLKALAPKAKKTKAARLGVSTKYQSTYTREQVEVALGSAWAESDQHPPVVENETGIRAKVDAAYSGTYPVMVIDVRTAMERACTKSQQRALFVRYMMGLTGRAAAYHAGIPRSDIEQVTHDAVSLILDELNDDLSNYVHDGRTAMSNATARAIQENSYGGR